MSNTQKTPLGVMPSDWSCKTLAQVSNGTQNGLYKPKNHYVDDGQEMVHMPDIFGQRFIQNGKMQKVSLSNAELKRFSLKEGDLLFARRSLKVEGVGKCALVKKLTSPVSFESSIIRVTPNRDELNPLFAFHFFESTKGRSQMMKYARQVAVSGITGDDLQDYYLPIPPIAEQNKIAEIISTCDRAIELLNLSIDKLELGLKHQVKTLFRNMNVEPISLGALGKWVGGGTPSKANLDFWTNGTIPWISPKDMKGHEIDSSEDLITSAAAENSSTTLVPVNSILIVSRSGILQHTFPVLIAGREVAINQDLKALIPNEKFIPLYVAEYLRAHQSEVLKSCSKVGTTVESLDTDAFKAFKIPLPSIDRQRVISNYVETTRKVISIEKKMRTLFQLQKRGLIQTLLTGKVRVKV